MIESISKEAFFSIESLKLSWKRYLRVGQAEVKDHVGIDSFGWNFDDNIKRLHDQDKSGFLSILYLVPFLFWYILFINFLCDGSKGPNNYGPDPTS